MKTTATKNRALQVQARLQEIATSVQSNFIEMGRLIVEAEDNKLWEQIDDARGKPYKSLRQWLLEAIPYSKSYAYLARKAMKGLQGVPEARLKEIPMVNMKQLIKLPAPQRKSAKWVNDAVDLPPREFTKRVNVVVMPNRPETTHVTFLLSDVIGRALAQSNAELAGHGSRQQQLEHLCEVYLDIRRPAKRKSRVA